MWITSKFTVLFYDNFVVIDAYRNIHQTFIFHHFLHLSNYHQRCFECNEEVNQNVKSVRLISMMSKLPKYWHQEMAKMLILIESFSNQYVWGFILIIAVQIQSVIVPFVCWNPITSPYRSADIFNFLCLFFIIILIGKGSLRGQEASLTRTFTKCNDQNLDVKILEMYVKQNVADIRICRKYHYVPTQK